MQQAQQPVLRGGTPASGGGGRHGAESMVVGSGTAMEK